MRLDEIKRIAMQSELERALNRKPYLDHAFEPYNSRNLSSQQNAYNFLEKYVSTPAAKSIAGSKGNFGVMDLLGIPFTEDMGRMSGRGAAENNYRDVALGTGGILLSAADPTKAIGKVAKPVINKVKSSITSIPDYVFSKGFLTSTPTKPNPLVGTRYETTPQGLLVPKREITPDELLGSMIVPKYSDATTRNQLLTEVSGQTLKKPVLTKSGFEYPRDRELYNKKVIYASNEDAAKTDVARLQSASAKGKELGGTGDTFLAPTTMGEGSEYFGGMTSDTLLNFIDNGKMTNELIDQLDNEIRKGIGLGVAMPNWKGIMSAEGRKQLEKEGKYRVALSKRMEKQKYQKALEFNVKDIEGGLIIPELKGKQNTIGHTLIKTDDPNKLHLVDGTHPAYNKDIIGGQYAGGFKEDMPLSELYGDNFMQQLLTGTIPNQNILRKNYVTPNINPKTGKITQSTNPVGDSIGAMMMTKDGGIVSKFMDEKSVDALIKKGLIDNSKTSKVGFGLLNNNANPTKSGGLLQKNTSSVWDEPTQAITSADTSINSSKLPAAFTQLNKEGAFKKGSVNIDIGGGRFNNADELLQKSDATNLVYDPFNRTKAHNANVVDAVSGGNADTATINNVLNVIDGEANQLKVLNQAKDAVKKDGEVFISVYQGKGDGIGKTTSKGFQQNKKAADYLDLVKKVFPNAKLKNGVIRATNK